MNKQAKYGRFEAQQFLEAEIRAKQQALDELRVARTRCDETEKELFEANRKIRLQKEEMERVERENRRLREKLYSQRGSVVDVPDLVDYSNSRGNNSSFFNMMPTNGTNDFSMMSSESRKFASTFLGNLSEYGYGSDFEHSPQARFSPGMPSPYENARFVTSTPSTASTMQMGQGYRSSPKVLQTLNNALNGKGHRFTHVELLAPTKCGYCTSILVGLDRQGEEREFEEKFFGRVWRHVRREDE